MSLMTDDAFVRFVQRHIGVTEDGLAGDDTRDKFLAAIGKAPEAQPAPARVQGWDGRSARNLQGVHPDLVRVITRARDASPLRFVVIEGLRTVERQKQLVAQGASRTMRSRHLTGHAIDIVPLDTNGQPAFAWPLYDKLLPYVREAAKADGVALTFGADWASFRDGPHIELSWAAYP